MRALTIQSNGELRVEERPDPQPVDDQVLVRVAAAGLNRADLLQRAGLYPPPPGVPADIPGMEFSGTVDALGPTAGGLAVGDRVFGIVAGGAQAELVVTRTSHCALVPDSLDLVPAGGVPEAFVTAHDALRTQAGLTSGEVVLVHAVGSGVGLASLALAQAFGSSVVGTARTPAKLERARELGLTHAIVAPDPFDPVAMARAIVDACGGVDVALDLVGGEYIGADVLAANPRARIVLIGTLAGGKATLPILAMMSKRLTMMGTVLRTRSDSEKAAATSAFSAEVVPLLASGEVAPEIEGVFPLAAATDAYERLASDATFGKLVLSMT